MGKGNSEPENELQSACNFSPLEEAIGKYPECSEAFTDEAQRKAQQLQSNVPDQYDKKLENLFDNYSEKSHSFEQTYLNIVFPLVGKRKFSDEEVLSAGDRLEGELLDELQRFVAESDDGKIALQNFVLKRKSQLHKWSHRADYLLGTPTSLAVFSTLVVIVLQGVFNLPEIVIKFAGVLLLLLFGRFLFMAWQHKRLIARIKSFVEAAEGLLKDI